MIVTTQIKVGGFPSRKLLNKIKEVVNEHSGSIGKIKHIRVSRTINYITIYIHINDFFKATENLVNGHKRWVTNLVEGILLWEGEDVR
jgi:hypothetical protein